MPETTETPVDTTVPVAPPTPPPLSYGEQAVGLTFNPGGSPMVDRVKRLYADIIDELNIMRGNCQNPEKKRLLSVAITEAQTAQMWAVKGITWTDEVV